MKVEAVFDATAVSVTFWVGECHSGWEAGWLADPRRLRHRRSRRVAANADRHKVLLNHSEQTSLICS